MVAGAILVWGNNSVSPTTSTRYLTSGYDDVLAPVIAGIVQFRLARAGTIRNLRVRHNVTAGNGNLISYTVRINNVVTLLSVSMASTAADGSDLVNSVVVAAGDLIDIEVTKGLDIVTSPTFIAADLELA
jgi:hypothetical protein